MSRNGKNNSAGLVVAPALKAAVICFMIIASCVGYVWQKKQISDLSQQIRIGERAVVQLRANNDKLRKQYAALVSPAALESRARDLKLGLALPRPEQILRLPDPALEKSHPPVQPPLIAGRNPENSPQ